MHQVSLRINNETIHYSDQAIGDALRAVATTAVGDDLTSEAHGIVNATFAKMHEMADQLNLQIQGFQARPLGDLSETIGMLDSLAHATPKDAPLDCNLFDRVTRTDSDKIREARTRLQNYHNMLTEFTDIYFSTLGLSVADVTTVEGEIDRFAPGSIELSRLEEAAKTLESAREKVLADSSRSLIDPLKLVASDVWSDPHFLKTTEPQLEKLFAAAKAIAKNEIAWEQFVKCRGTHSLHGLSGSLGTMLKATELEAAEKEARTATSKLPVISSLLMGQPLMLTEDNRDTTAPSTDGWLVGLGALAATVSSYFIGIFSTCQNAVSKQFGQSHRPGRPKGLKQQRRQQPRLKSPRERSAKPEDKRARQRRRTNEAVDMGSTSTSLSTPIPVRQTTIVLPQDVVLQTVMAHQNQAVRVRFREAVLAADLSEPRLQLTEEEEPKEHIRREVNKLLGELSKLDGLPRRQFKEALRPLTM